MFRLHQQRVPVALAELDRDLLEVVISWLDASGIPYEREEGEEDVRLRVGASPHLPDDLREGTVAAIGASKQHAALSLAHPLYGRRSNHRAARRPAWPLSSPEARSCIATRANAGDSGS